MACLSTLMLLLYAVEAACRVIEMTLVQQSRGAKWEAHRIPNSADPNHGASGLGSAHLFRSNQAWWLRALLARNAVRSGSI
jgi:hypothetical protein